MSKSERKQILPRSGSGSNSPTKAYLSLKFMKPGEEFRGIFRGSYSRQEADPNTGEMKTRVLHYFSTLNPGKVRKLDKFGEAVITEYAAGDKIAINGTVKLNDIVSQIQANDIVLIVKKGTLANKNGKGETQDLEVFVEGNAGPATEAVSTEAADDNDDVNF
jgi:hypothetical protein